MFNYNGVKIELRKSASGAYIEIDMDSGSRYTQTNLTDYPIEEFKNLQRDLVAALNRFQKNPDLQHLKVLATIGYAARNFLRAGFVRKKCEKYFADFEHLYTKKQTEEIILEITFPNQFSFSFGLLFPVDPKKIDWEHGDIQNIIDQFLGMRMYIQNKYASKKHSSLRNLIKRLNTGGTTQVIHAMDNRLETGIEGGIWKKYDAGRINASFVTDTEDLIRQWLNMPALHLIHFSSHLYFDPAKASYVLTLTGGETFEAGALARSADYSGLEFPPLIFFNTCDSASNSFNAGESINMIENLFPDFALGFIATMFSVNNTTAGKMADKFYEYFFEENMTILMALEKAKEYLIFAEGQYSVLGYNLWEADVFLTYRKEIKGKNKRKINPKKKRHE